MKSHRYNTRIEWTGNKGAGTFDYRSYSRSHVIRVEGKADILGSSDSSFRGDRAKHNPEDLFVSSIAACHMLWYLHLCSEADIVVLTYEDNAEGEMILASDGSGRFNEIVLRPKILISQASDQQKALELHEDAQKMCFLANSCNFKVRHEPLILQ